MSYGTPTLRPYQTECVESVFREFQTVDSTLAVMATGTGKSVVLSNIVKRFHPKRSLIIAHRKELIHQAARHVQHTGLETEIEMANLKADASMFGNASVVVASVQTLGSDKRISKLNPEDFGLLVIDECFPAGTLVDGRPIETIQVGDVIATHQGQGYVTHVFKNKAKPLVRIYISDGNTLTCTLDHPVWTVSGWKRAIDLIPQDMVLTQKGFHFGVARVDGYKVLQGSGDEFERVCPDGFVYNLEVSNGNTYFANGILVHNCHHSISGSYKKVIEYFQRNPNLKLFGCTATPDRSDEAALGKVFQSVAFTYDIRQAIDDGYLVPILQQTVQVGSLDYSHVRTTAGDLNGADLEAIMLEEKNLQGVTGAAIEIIGGKRTIVFTVSVKQAEQCANIFNRHKAGMAASISGKTPPGERDMIVKRFGCGEIQVLVNCGVVSEGFDVPECECIVMARPTKSRSLFTQMVGRAGRPIASVLSGLDTSEARKAAIAASPKPNALIVDFVGNSGRHKLISTADILGGNYDDEIKETARKKAEKASGPVDMDAMLKESERERRERIELAKIEEEARKARLVAKVQYSTRTIDPFELFGVKPVAFRWDTGRKFSFKQRAMLLNMGVNPDEIQFDCGTKLIQEHIRRIKNKLCSLKQAKVLQKFGYDPKDVTFQEASKIIDGLASSGWRRQ